MDHLLALPTEHVQPLRLILGTVVKMDLHPEELAAADYLLTLLQFKHDEHTCACG